MAMNEDLVKPPRANGPSQTLAKGLQVLDLLVQTSSGLRLTAVAKHLDLNLNTAGRLLTTLEASGFARRNSKGEYAPGAKLVAAAVRHLNVPALATIARPFLMTLRDATSETAYIVVRVGSSLVLLDVADGILDLRLVLRPGSVFHLFPAPTGFVLTSEISVDEVVALSQRIGEESRIVTPSDVIKTRNQLKRYGFIVGHAALTSAGTFTVAMPVRRHGKIVASLGVAGPSQRFHEKAIAPHAELFRDVSERMSQAVEDV